MEIHPIAKLIVQKGLAGFDGSMFSEAQRVEIFGQASQIFFRQGRFDEGIEALEKGGLPLPADKLRELADRKMLLGKHEEAYKLLAKIGDDKMAEFVRTNFLDN
ncbi:hypothetical protein ACFL0V_00505 [Nanoarchaeota archaeon]